MVRLRWSVNHTMLDILNSLLAGVFFMTFCRLLTFFKINFFKNSLRNTIRILNSLDPDQAGHSVGPDLGNITIRQ